MNMPRTEPLCSRCSICLVKLRRRWYRCLRCYNFRLCSACYDKPRNWGLHTVDHPMQRVINKESQGMFYHGQIGLASSGVFTCPYCCRMGLSSASLQDHLEEFHHDSPDYVNCPICLSSPDNLDSQLIQNLLGHVSNFNYMEKNEISSGDDIAGTSIRHAASTVFCLSSSSSESNILSQ